MKRALLLSIALIACAWDGGDDCPTAARVVVTLDKPVLLVGESTQARAKVYDAQGRELVGCKITWSVIDERPQ